MPKLWVTKRKKRLLLLVKNMMVGLEATTHSLFDMLVNHKYIKKSHLVKNMMVGLEATTH